LERGLENAEFYVHYEGFNKRLDEWVKYSQLKVEKVEVPRAKKKPPTLGSAGSKGSSEADTSPGGQKRGIRLVDRQ